MEDHGFIRTQEYGIGRRFAGELPHAARTAFHWDNINLGQELVIRPVGKGWWVVLRFNFCEMEALQ